MLRTKIICTLGPASDSPETLRALINSGLDVARLNFSHGTHEEHLVRLNMLREAAADKAFLKRTLETQEAFSAVDTEGESEW